jgi:hypothetical protein
MVATSPLKKRPELVISWDSPPDDFQLDDTPVENTGQPLIAGALRESLEVNGRIQTENLIASNFGLCVRVGSERRSTQYCHGIYF